MTILADELVSFSVNHLLDSNFPYFYNALLQIKKIFPTIITRGYHPSSSQCFGADIVY